MYLLNIESYLVPISLIIGVSITSFISMKNAKNEEPKPQIKKVKILEKKKDLTPSIKEK